MSVATQLFCRVMENCDRDRNLALLEGVLRKVGADGTMAYRIQSDQCRKFGICLFVYAAIQLLYYFINHFTWFRSNGNFIYMCLNALGEGTQIAFPICLAIGFWSYYRRYKEHSNVVYEIELTRVD
jgi:hypothetical protein